MSFRAGAEGEVGDDVAAELPDADREAKPANPTVVPPPKPPGGKLSVILAALRSDDGASIDTLISLTGWLPHTTRAALTRLRQRGFPITHYVENGRTIRRLAPPATDVDHAA